MRLLCLRTINLKAKLEYLRKETKISEMIARPPRIYILVIFRKILTQITIHIYIYILTQISCTRRKYPNLFSSKLEKIVFNVYKYTGYMMYTYIYTPYILYIYIYNLNIYIYIYI